VDVSLEFKGKSLKVKEFLGESLWRLEVVGLKINQAC